MLYQTQAKQPEVHLCINKGRLKNYKKDLPTYYLKNQTEFQLEIFNPTTNTVLAKILINNKQLTQGGLVLRPGERIFLERYIDVAKKFKFETYEVSDTDDVKEAIKNNGDIRVDFYNEQVNYNRMLLTSNNPTYTYYNGDMTFGTCSTSNINSTIGTLTNTGGVNVTYNNQYQKTFTGQEPQTRSAAPIKKFKSLETGRVEMGGASDQKFGTVSKDWAYVAFHTVEFKMLPESQKEITSQDLHTKTYCSFCGKRVKHTDNFCGSCGQKI